MNIHIKAEWLARLRSGTIEQGKNVLRSEDEKYCCLGVLCEMAVEAGIIEPPLPPTEDYTADNDTEIRGYLYAADTEGDDEDACVDERWYMKHYLPEAVQEWAGLLDKRGDLAKREINGDSLAQLNDAGMSFADIADIIEKAL